MPCLIQYCQFHEQQNQKRSVIKQFAAEYKVVRYWGIGVSEMKQNFRIQNKICAFGNCWFGGKKRRSTEGPRASVEKSGLILDCIRSSVLLWNSEYVFGSF